MSIVLRMFLKVIPMILILLPIHLEGQADSAFGWIRDLSGSWEGTFEWSGARTGSGKMNATYHLTGNGSAVVESLMIESRSVMTTVYHMDGNDLRMTHYCAAQNQPRLKAFSIDPAERRISFNLVDITNLADPADGHVDRFEMQLKDENQITLQFTFQGKGQESIERIALTRTSTQ